MLLNILKDKGGGHTLPLLLLVTYVGLVHTDPDVTVTLNTRKVLATLDEKFLSFTIDPEELASHSYGTASRSMALALAPAYLRVAGPSSNNYTLSGDYITMNKHLFHTSLWRNFNTFMESSGIKVILGLNVLNRFQNVWDSASAVNVINQMEKHQLEADYQIGYENQEYLLEFSSEEVASNVNRLRGILNTARRSSNAAIVGPDFTQLDAKVPEQVNYVRNFLKVAGENINAITLHPSFSDGRDVATVISKAMEIFDDSIFLNARTKKKPIWLAESELEEKGRGFEPTIRGIQELGQAALNGVGIFLLRPQPFSPEKSTADFWMAALYKALVGPTVLSAKSSWANVPTFVHCTKPSTYSNPNNYDEGSITVFGANVYTEEVQLTLKLTPLRDEMAHIYILTYNETSGKSYLNGNELSISANGELPVITPIEKELMANIKNSADHNVIMIDKRSIFFIVLPENRPKACITNDRLNNITAALNKKTLKSPGRVSANVKSILKSNDRVHNFQKPDIELAQKLPSFNVKTNKAFVPTPEKDIKTKYVTFSGNDWLSKFPEKVHKNTLFDDEFPKNSVLDMNSYNRFRRHDYGHHTDDDDELNIIDNVVDDENQFEELSKFETNADDDEEDTDIDDSYGNESSMNDAIENRRIKMSREDGFIDFFKRFKNNINTEYDKEEMDAENEENYDLSSLQHLKQDRNELESGEYSNNETTDEELSNDEDAYETEHDIPYQNFPEEVNSESKKQGTEMKISEVDTDEAENHKDELFSENDKNNSSMVKEAEDKLRNEDIDNTENLNLNVDYMRETEYNHKSKDITEASLEDQNLPDIGGEEAITMLPKFEGFLTNLPNGTNKIILDDQYLQKNGDKTSAIVQFDSSDSKITQRKIARLHEKKNAIPKTTIENNKEMAAQQTTVSQVNIKSLPVSNDTINLQNNIIKNQRSKKFKRDLNAQSNDFTKSVNGDKSFNNDKNVTRHVMKIPFPVPLDENDKIIFVPQITMFDSSFHKIGVLDSPKEEYHSGGHIAPNVTNMVAHDHIHVPESEFDSSFNKIGVLDSPKEEYDSGGHIAPNVTNTEAHNHIEVPESEFDSTFHKIGVLDSPREGYNNSNTAIPATINTPVKTTAEEQVNSLHMNDDFTSAEEEEVIKRVTENRKRSPNFNTFLELSEPFPAVKRFKEHVDYPSYKNIIHHATSYSPSKASSKELQHGSKTAVTSFVPKHVTHKHEAYISHQISSTLPKVDKEKINENPVNDTSLETNSAHYYFESKNSKTNETKNDSQYYMKNNKTQLNSKYSNENITIDTNRKTELTKDDQIESEPSRAAVNSTNSLNKISDVIEIEKDVRLNSNISLIENKIDNENDNSTVLNINQMVDPTISSEELGVKYNSKRSRGTIKNDYERMISEILRENKNQEEGIVAINTNIKEDEMDNEDLLEDEKDNDQRSEDVETEELPQSKETFKRINTYQTNSEKYGKHYQNNQMLKSIDKNKEYDEVEDKITDNTKDYEQEEEEEEEEKGEEKDSEELRKYDIPKKQTLRKKYMKKTPKKSINEDYENNYYENNYMKYKKPQYNRSKWSKNAVNKKKLDENKEKNDYILVEKDRDDTGQEEEIGSTFFKTLLKFKNVKVANDESVEETNNNTITYKSAEAITSISSVSNKSDTNSPGTQQESVTKESKPSIPVKLETQSKVQEKPQLKRIMRNINNQNYYIESKINKYYKMNKDKEFVQLFPFSYNSTHDKLLDMNSNNKNDNLIVPKTSGTTATTSYTSKEPTPYSPATIIEDTVAKSYNSKEPKPYVPKSNLTPTTENSGAAYYNLKEPKPYSPKSFPATIISDSSATSYSSKESVPFSPKSKAGTKISASSATSHNSKESIAYSPKSKAATAVDELAVTSSYSKEPIPYSRKPNPGINEKYTTKLNVEKPKIRPIERIEPSNIGSDSTISEIKTMQDILEFEDDEPYLSKTNEGFERTTKPPYKWSPFVEATIKEAVPYSKVSDISKDDSKINTDSKTDSDVFTDGYDSGTSVLYDFVSKHKANEKISPVIYPVVLPKNTQNVDVSKSYATVYDANKKEPINRGPSSFKFHMTNTEQIPTLQEIPPPENKQTSLGEPFHWVSKQDSKPPTIVKESTKQTTDAPKTDNETKEVDVIAEMKKAIFPNGSREKTEKKLPKRVKTLEERIKERIQKKRKKSKSPKKKKEIDEVDTSESVEDLNDSEHDETIPNKEVRTIKRKATKDNIKGTKSISSKIVKYTDAKDHEYLTKEEAIIKQKDKTDNIPTELLKLDHDLEVEEIKRNNRGILSNVVTKPEHEKALKVADTILGGVQSFVQQLDPLAGGTGDNLINPKEPKKKPKSKLKSKIKLIKKKVKPQLLKKNLIKPMKKKSIIPRSLLEEQQEELTKSHHPKSIFAKSKRNILGYKNRFAKKRHQMKRDLKAVDHKMYNTNIKQDENEHLMNEIYNNNDGQKEVRRFSRHISSVFNPLSSLEYDDHTNDNSIEELFSSNSRDNIPDTNVFHERLKYNKNNQALGKNGIRPEKSNRKVSSEDLFNNYSMTDENDKSLDDRTSKSENNGNKLYSGLGFRNKDESSLTFNDACEESLYNLVSENNVVDDYNSLVSPVNINTENEEESESDSGGIIKHLLEEDSIIRNMQKELNVKYVENGRKDEENGIDWSKFILKEKRQDKNTQNWNGMKKKAVEVIPQRKEDVPLYTDFDHVIEEEEEVTSDLNNLPEEIRHKRSVDSRENNIDDVDLELKKTNELKQFHSIQNFIKPLKNKLKYSTEALNNTFHKSNINVNNKSSTEATDVQNTKVAKQINNNEKLGDQFAKDKTSPDNKDSIMIKEQNLTESKKDLPKKENEKQNPVYRLSYKKPLYIERPNVKTYKTYKYVGNNMVSELKNDITPPKKMKIYLKKFNRHKRAKRMTDNGSTLRVIENEDSTNPGKLFKTRPNYSLITNLIYKRPKLDPVEDILSSKSKKVAHNDDFRNMMLKNNYEAEIRNEMGRAKQKMYDAMRKKDDNVNLKKINNEVDLLEYLEVQKSMKSKINRNKTEETDDDNNKYTDDLNIKKKNYIKSYQKVFNQILDNMNNLPRAAGVENLNNQIEVLKEPLSKNIVTGLQIEDESDQPTILFDDDFQKALIYKTPLVSVDDAESIEDQNIIHTILINPINTFSSNVKGNTQSLQKGNENHETINFSVVPNKTISQDYFPKVADNTLTFGNIVPFDIFNDVNKSVTNNSETPSHDNSSATSSEGLIAGTNGPIIEHNLEVVNEKSSDYETKNILKDNKSTNEEIIKSNMIEDNTENETPSKQEIMVELLKRIVHRIGNIFL